MDFDVLGPVNIIARCLKYIGAWKTDGFYQKLYSIYMIVMYIVSVLTTVSLSMFLIMEKNLESEVFFSGLNVLFSVIGTYVKLKNMLFIRRENCFKFVASMNDLEFRPNSKSELKYYLKEYKSFGFTLKCYIGGPAVFLMIAFTSSLIASGYVLPFTFWFPFNWKNENTYWYAYGATATGMIHIVFLCAFLDLFHMFILCYMAVIYKVLHYRLESLGKATSKRTMVKDLVKVMIFHKKVQLMAKECEAIVSIPILIQMLLSALVLCLTAYQLTRMSIFTTPGLFLQIIDYSIVMTLQIYLPCYYGNEITINCGNLSNALYNSEWMDLDIKSKKMIYIYMEYLKSPVILKAGNFFEISLGVFTNVVNYAYSMFAILLKQ